MRYRASVFAADTRAVALSRDFTDRAAASLWLAAQGRDGYIMCSQDGNVWFHHAAVKHGQVYRAEPVVVNLTTGAVSAVAAPATAPT